MNLADNEGKTALHWAAKFGREEITNLLAQNGAMVNLKDNDGRTPLYYAVEHGN